MRVIGELYRRHPPRLFRVMGQGAESNRVGTFAEAVPLLVHITRIMLGSFRAPLLPQLVPFATGNQVDSHANAYPLLIVRISGVGDVVEHIRYIGVGHMNGGGPRRGAVPLWLFQRLNQRGGSRPYIVGTAH